MTKENFEGLKQSIIEAGQIMRGEIPPSREFIYEVPPDRPKPATMYAICVETDDETLLIPRKVYEITVSGKYASLTDEEGESAVYPVDFFIPLQLPAEAAQRLRQTVR